MTIGAHFLDELRAAGVQLDGMSWGPEGLIYADDYPASERAKAQAVFDAHDADVPPPSIEVQAALSEVEDAKSAALWHAVLSGNTTGVLQLEETRQELLGLLRTGERL